MHDALIYPRGVSRSEADQRLASSERLTAVEGLAIYQRSYFLRIASCMREQFPALCHAVGEDLFNDFVAEYIRAEPPESYTLYDLGRRFPSYLEASRPDRDAASGEREAWVEFMIDLATFERQLFVMFDAPGHEGKPFAEPATPDGHLRLQPCFALGSYRFPVALYYHQVRKGNDAKLPPLETSFVALVRTNYLTHTIPLSHAHYRFLKAMEGGSTVDHALGAVSDQLSIPMAEVRRSWMAEDGMRRRWIETGFFIAPANARTNITHAPD